MKNPNEGPNNPEQNFGIMGAVERLELYYRTPYLAVDLNSWSIFYRKRLIKNCLLELWHDVDENWVVIPEEERPECSDMIEYFIMQISFDNGHCPLDVPFKYEYAIPPGCQSSYTTEQVYCRSQLDEVWRACQRLLSAARCSC